MSWRAAVTAKIARFTALYGLYGKLASNIDAAVQALDVAPQQALAIEDSPNGILAAKRAGLFCLAVPNALTRQLSLDLADLRLDSLADLPLEQLLDAFRAR